MSKKILLIEDEAPLVRILRDTLLREGFEVVVARDGREGLIEMFAQQPHLVLLDIMMPVMGGITLLKKFQEDEWARTVPVIILTNLDNPDLVMEAVEFGPLVAPPVIAEAQGGTESSHEAIKNYLKERITSGLYEVVVKRDWSLKDITGKIRRKLEDGNSPL